MEGFGLPAVEAMACGTPVISSRAGSLPEVIGDAGLFFDPTDIPSMTASISQLLANHPLRDDLAAKALEHHSHFSWDRAARLLLHHFDDLLGVFPGRSAACGPRQGQEPHESSTASKSINPKMSPHVYAIHRPDRLIADLEFGPGLALHIAHQPAHPGVFGMLLDEGLDEEIGSVMADLSPERERLGHLRINDLGLHGSARMIWLPAPFGRHRVT